MPVTLDLTLASPTDPSNPLLYEAGVGLHSSTAGLATDFWWPELVFDPIQEVTFEFDFVLLPGHSSDTVFLGASSLNSSPNAPQESAGYNFGTTSRTISGPTTIAQTYGPGWAGFNSARLTGEMRVAFHVGFNYGVALAAVRVTNGGVASYPPNSTGSVDPPPNPNLTGTGGTIAGFNPGAGGVLFHYTPPFDGSFVMRVSNPFRWSPNFAVYNDDGEELYVDTDGILGVICGKDELLRVLLTPDPKEGNPGAVVTVVWSYAQRASSRLEVALESDVINETPGSLYATISIGRPLDTVTLSLLGPTRVQHVQTAVLNNYGYIEDLAVQLPAIEPGDYFLRVAGVASGTEDVPFTVTGDPLSYAGAGAKSLPVAPDRTDQLRWRLYGLHDQEPAYEFVHNPRSWSNLLPPGNYTHEKTTALEGQILTWQAGEQPWRMEFTGYLDTEAEYVDLTFWANLHRRFWLVDHRNRAWLVTFEQFDATAKIVPNKPWAHDYTMKTIIFMQG